MADAESASPSESERPSVTRRDLIAGAAGALAASALDRVVPKPAQAQQATAPAQTPPADPTRIQGGAPTPLGDRSPFEQPRRQTASVVSWTPHQDLQGTITPADLHYERHHAGVPSIDPAQWELVVHGLVERPMVFTLDELKRLPAVSRICFLECSGNFGGLGSEELTPQRIAGLTSQSEWTGVPLSLVLREAGVREGASWFTAEGMDAAVLSRSIPLEKGFDDALLAYAQNGEAIRPEQGYPVRLLLPGWEGNTSVKWLRRLELTEGPAMSREETSKYTEGIRGGRARQFSFVMDARSLITSPCYPQTVAPGWNEIRGIAWSGRGRIERVDLSFDEGESWIAADLQEPVLPKAHTRFRHAWRWDGSETTVLSRATDETGYVQPTAAELWEARGRQSGPYHLNPITGWRIRSDGSVVFRTEEG